MKELKIELYNSEDDYAVVFILKMVLNEHENNLPNAICMCNCIVYVSVFFIYLFGVFCRLTASTVTIVSRENVTFNKLKPLH